MTPSIQIDTTSLLTILGVIAAVWALISPTDRLRLRFSMTWWDWGIACVLFALIHYLTFAQALESVGLYYALGPWRWGMDSTSAVYLLLLFGSLYFFLRSRHPILASGKVAIYHQLLDTLHMTSRYDELVLLVEPQLPKLIALTKRKSLLSNLISRLDSSPQDLAAILRGENPKARPAWKEHLSAILHRLSDRRQMQSSGGEQAHEILMTLVTSPKLTNHLAVSYPHFCLKILDTEEALRSDFIEHYIDALLDAPGSRLYIELKNNQNLNGGNRLALPESNRLLRFFFLNASLAIKRGMDRAIGEAICRRLDEDDILVETLNKPLGSYYQTRRFRCPINSGITLFEIMVHEGIHQGYQDHMWLHYFGHFVEKILKRMPDASDEDSYEEWQTPFHYLLYRMISISTDWAEQCARISNSEIPEETKISESFDSHFISKAATKVLGRMMENVMMSKKLSDSFKRYLLEVVVRSYVRVRQDKRLADVASSLISEVVFGLDFPTKAPYRRKLGEIFANIDHVLRHDAPKFEEAIDSAVS